METDLLVGLARVLGAMGSASHPDALAASIVTHLRGPLCVETAAILGLRGDRLLVLGLDGFDPSEVDGLSSMSLDDAYPSVRALREGEIVIDDIAEVDRVYPGRDAPTTRWQRIRTRLPDGSSVAVPAIVDGRGVGALAVLCVGKREWSTLELAALGSIGSALGVWMTHPDSGLPPEDLDLPDDALTPRQLTILQGAADGMSNADIAVALHVSTSTVKQEVRRAIEVLGADSRGDAVARAMQAGLLREASR